MEQEIITGIIVYAAVVASVVMSYINLRKAYSSGNKCSGTCTGCKIDLSKIKEWKEKSH